MNAVTAASQWVPVQPASSQSFHDASQLPAESEVALTFETVHIRSETITSVLEDILRCEFRHRATSETER